MTRIDLPATRSHREGQGNLTSTVKPELAVPQDVHDHARVDTESR